MRITKYTVEVPNILVKESAVNYDHENSFTSPDSIANMLNNVFRLDKKAEEFLYMIAFNTKMKLIGVFEISHGTVNISLVNPREIFIRALLCGASNIVISHNHPSGETNPSKEDIEATEKVKEAGKLIGIPLLDHIIIGDGTLYSFNEHSKVV